MKALLIAAGAIAIALLICWNSPLGLAAAAGITAYRYNFWRMLENLWHSLDD